MIPTDLYDSYTTAIAENDRQAKAALAAIIAALDPSDIDAIRDTMLEAYPALVKLYGERASQVALEFYMGVRAAQEVEESFEAEISPMDDGTYGECVSDVRREVGGLYSGKTTLDSFTSTMQGLATKRAMGMADSTIYALAAADPAHPKAAFVPHAGACAWCVLMGSRGFTNTKEAAEHMRHLHCLCTVVVDFDAKNPSLKGYDPSEYYAAYEKYSGDMEFQHELAEEWASMTEEQKAKYVRRTRTRDGQVKEHPGDWSTYVRNRTVQRMNVDLGNTRGTLIDKMKTTNV